METTKKLNEVPLEDTIQSNQSIVVVDEDGNVIRAKLPEVESIPDEYIGGLE